MVDANEKIVTEEEKQDNERWNELNKKPVTELTEDDKKEIGDLRDRYGKRVQTRFDQMTRKQREAEERADRAEKELEEVKKSKEKPEPKKFDKDLVNETFEIDGVAFYTDEALMARVSAGLMTEQKAFTHQQQRLKNEVASETIIRIEKKQALEEERKIRNEDSKKLLEEHPEFDAKHPNHNPDEPLFKLANEIFMEGYRNNPRGLTLALKRAKEILRIEGEQERDTEHLSVTHSLGTGTPRNAGGDKPITLLPEEQEAAIRMYCKGDVVNLKTGKPYTEKEAIDKAIQGKKTQLVRPTRRAL